ncbi:MAG: PKD domain-containing protein [Bryobacteraceae bacterium]
MRLFDVARPGRWAYGLAITLFIFGANAQTTTPIAAENEIRSMTVEARIPISNIGSSIVPNIQPDVLQAITSGALELRQQIVFPFSASKPPGSADLPVGVTLPPQGQFVRTTTFLVAPGSPTPTPDVAQEMMLDSHMVAVESIKLNDKPSSNLLIVGSVFAHTEVGPYGDLTGASWVMSAGYNNETPVQFRNIAVTAAGAVTFFATQGSGSLELAEGGPGGPGEPGGNRQPIADAGLDQTVTVIQHQLDGSASSDPDGDTLTYNWVVVGRTVSIINSNTAKPIIQFGQGFGDYIFELTVTDGKGGTATDRVTINYIGR